jgi:hypothetical protein
MHDGEMPQNPADLKMLETILNEMNGQKRMYVTQKIKNIQTQLKRLPEYHP